MPAEEWRPVEGYPYEVSSEGRVRRKGRQVLKPRPNSNGYLRVSLGAGCDAYIHRLVCRAFNGEPTEARDHADHINHDRTDNRAANLRWMSPSENRESRNFKLTEDTVRLVRNSPLSDVQLAKQLGVKSRTIRDARNRKSWSHVDAHQ